MMGMDSCSYDKLIKIQKTCTFLITVTGFMDFVHHLLFKSNAVFWELDQFSLQRASSE
jgi:hypothetical protein